MTPLTSTEQTETFLGDAEPRWVFKHSNTCPVSSAALDEVTAFLSTHNMPLGMVVVQEARPVSNWLATRLAYVHQSPQLFLIRNGKVTWHASHWGITATAMAQALSSTAK